MAYKPKKREPILRAAAEVFSRQGYHAATTAEIAVAAGFRGSIYYHISTKEQLLFDVLMDGMEQAFVFLKQAEAIETSSADRLTFLIARTIRANCEMEHPGMSLTFAFIEPNVLEEEHWKKYVAARDKYERSVRKMIETGVREGQFKMTDSTLETRMILGSMNWIRVWFRPGGPLTSDQVVEWYSRRLIENISARTNGHKEIELPETVGEALKATKTE